MNGLTSMNGDEFVRKVLEGERDFRGIALDAFLFDIFPEQKEIINYLKNQDLKASPLLISGSDFSFMVAEEFYAPYTLAENTYFDHARLKGSNWSYANLKGANFEVASLEGADLFEADLRGANLYTSNLLDASLKYANLVGVKNLERAMRLETVSFDNTVVTKKERAIIKRAFISAANKYFFKVTEKVSKKPSLAAQ